MTIKCTMLIQDATAISNPNAPIHRIGGWSESWYFPGVDLTIATNYFLGVQAGNTIVPGLCQQRAALLPLGAAVVGQRFQTVDPLGPSQSLATALPSSSGLPTGPPQNALLIKVPGTGVRNIKRFIMRGIPAGQITEGEYAPTQPFAQALSAFITGLSPFLFRGRDLSQATFSVITVGADGTVTTQLGLNYNVLDMVRLLKVRDANGTLRGGRFQVVSIGPGPNVVKLLNWPFGPCTGGTIRKDAVVYPSVNSGQTQPGRVVTRRVGRPFVQFRGRRSRRK